MSPPPPPPPPSEGLTPRTDAGARKIIERLDELSKRFGDMAGKVEDAVSDAARALRRTEELRETMKRRPTKQQVLKMIGVCVAGVIALVWNVTWMVSTRTADASAGVVEKKLDAFEQKIEARIQKSDQLHQLEHRELYDSQPKKKRSQLLEKPVPRMDGGTP